MDFGFVDGLKIKELSYCIQFEDVEAHFYCFQKQILTLHVNIPCTKTTYHFLIDSQEAQASDTLVWLDIFLDLF